MTVFRLLLILIFVAIAGYTAVTISAHGLNLFPDFFGDMAQMGWPGQFNFDFMMMLVLSGLWVMWRNGFTPGGIALGCVAFFGGALFLSAYLLFLTSQTKGDMTAVLLGPTRT